MKKRIFICILSLMMIGSLVGCQGSEGINPPSIDIPGIDIQEAEELEIKDNTDAEGEDQVEESQPPENESIKNDTIQDDTAESAEEKTYNLEEYGTVGETRQEYFADGTRDVSYYYMMEIFFFRDTLSNAASINHTLQQIYDVYEESYMEEAAVYASGEEDVLNTPYAYLHILALEYVGDDYVSILFNDIYYMGGAHPDSSFDGITIDCKTGEQVLASQLLGKSDEEILAEISNAMGLDSIATWDDVDFYLTDSTIVFFYRMPGFWEDVVLPREK